MVYCSDEKEKTKIKENQSTNSLTKSMTAKTPSNKEKPESNQPVTLTDKSIATKVVTEFYNALKLKNYPRMINLIEPSKIEEEIEKIQQSQHFPEITDEVKRIAKRNLIVGFQMQFSQLTLDTYKINEVKRISDHQFIFSVEQKYKYSDPQNGKPFTEVSEIDIIKTPDKRWYIAKSNLE